MVADVEEPFPVPLSFPSLVPGEAAVPLSFPSLVPSSSGAAADLDQVRRAAAARWQQQAACMSTRTRRPDSSDISGGA